MTNYHVLGENDIKEGEIELSLNNDKKLLKLILNDSRKIYTNRIFDITIIEIKLEFDNLDIDSFLEIDNQKGNPDEIYRQKSIGLIQYPNGKEVQFSDGVIKNIEEDNFSILHLCASNQGASGGPLINLINFQVIGIHKGSKDNYNYNLGTYIRLPIEDFNKKMNNKDLNEIFEEIRDKKINIFEGI